MIEVEAIGIFTELEVLVWLELIVPPIIPAVVPAVVPVVVPAVVPVVVPAVVPPVVPGHEDYLLNDVFCIELVSRCRTQAVLTYTIKRTLKHPSNSLPRQMMNMRAWYSYRMY